MNYIKIKNNHEYSYPYSIYDLKMENKNVSFPENIDDNLLLQYNVFPVFDLPYNEDYTKNYIEGKPVLVNNKYYQNWIITEASSEEIENRINIKWSAIRNQRNIYLQECDWTQLPDSPLSNSKKIEWSIYRQQLRDVTSQQDPFNIVWPIKPE